MSARGSTWGRKGEWLRVITLGLQRLNGADTRLSDLLYWLRSEEGRKAWPNRPDQLPEGTIKNYLTIARRAFGKPDGPWSIGQTIRGEHAIGPEALPVVIQVARLALSWGRPLTTRQACWVARLFPVLVPAVQRFSDEWAVVHLYGIATFYAVREQLLAAETPGGTFDTCDLDWLLLFAGGLGADPPVAGMEALGLKAAMKLGVLTVTLGEGGDMEGAGESGWIFTPDVQRMRLLADSGVPTERKILRWPLWKVSVVNFGLRVVAAQLGFNELPEERQRELARALRGAVEVNDIDAYASLTGLSLKGEEDGKA